MSSLPVPTCVNAQTSRHSSYLTHSIFTVIFPAHLLLLRLLRPHVPIKVYLRNIRKVTAEQVCAFHSSLEADSAALISSDQQLDLRPDQKKEIHYRLSRTIIWLTALLSVQVSISFKSRAR